MLIQFECLDTNAILSSSTPDGVRYLELFLKEYSITTGETNLNAGCRKCIANYLITYQKIKGKMDNANKSQYRLKEKYNNISLEFGSNVFVNNLNLTDEYAEILLKLHKKEDLFEVYPTDKIIEKTVENKPSRKFKKK
jgi:hypothetical protein